MAGRASSALLPLLLVLSGAGPCAPPPDWGFTDVTLEAGLDYQHGYPGGFVSIEALIAGGVAAGDVDADGHVDLYVVRGTLGRDLLFRNRGDGRFEEIGEAAGLPGDARPGSGPLFADLDGDGPVDLLIGGVAGARVRVLRNRGGGRFDDVTAESGIDVETRTFSAAAGDPDRDGDLDVLLSHWGAEHPAGPSAHLWQNDGRGRFVDASVEAGIAALLPVPSPFFPDNSLDLTFTPNWSDVNGDGWPDLLLASDFVTSQVLLNRGDGTFRDATPPAITDENGMGAAVGDYDGDLDLDWFVTSIFDLDIPDDGNWGGTGNRLYRNDGDGRFSDVTDEAGVREGFWGWGACFADFDNDGHLDLFHVNGMRPAAGFDADPSRLFHNRGDGRFDERSAELGIVDTGEGRGVVCFDYDRDGDVDIFVANNGEPPRLFRNDGGNARHFLAVRLAGPPGNTQGIGARLRVRALSFERDAQIRWGWRLAERAQVREIRAGSNFVSQDPAEAHFGLGSARLVRELEVRWPDGAVSRRRWLRADRLVTVSHPDAPRARKAEGRAASRRRAEERG